MSDHEAINKLEKGIKERNESNPFENWEYCIVVNNPDAFEDINARVINKARAEEIFEKSFKGTEGKSLAIQDKNKAMEKEAFSRAFDGLAEPNIELKGNTKREFSVEFSKDKQEGDLKRSSRQNKKWNMGGGYQRECVAGKVVWKDNKVTTKDFLTLMRN